MTKNNSEQEFPQNSKSKRVAPMRPELPIIEEGANIKPVEKPRKKTVGGAIRKKKTITQSIAQSFLGEEAKGVAHYILFDVLIPAAKNTIQEMVTQGIEMMLFGEARPRGRSKDRERTVVSYGSYYKKDRDDDRRESRRPSRRGDRFGLEEIFFKRPDECNEVLESLCDELEKYDQVTVADFFEMADIENEFGWIANKWGWEDLRKARCVHMRNGWTITLPEPIELD